MRRRLVLGLLVVSVLNSAPTEAVTYQDVGCVDGLCFPPLCYADGLSVKDTARLSHLRGQPLGYDYLGLCEIANVSRWLVLGNASGDPLPEHAPPSSPLAEPRAGCGDFPDEQPLDMQLLAVWLLILFYIFYGLGHVCEDFLVPALNVLCDRYSIPEDVAGATIMAAGCNAPELAASAVGVFVQHSTVGSGTVVGSASFNILCICAAASLAVGGRLEVDGWLLLREIASFVVALSLFLYALGDDLVVWDEALALVAFYGVYVALCIYYERLLRLLSRTPLRQWLTRRAGRQCMHTCDLHAYAAMHICTPLRQWLTRRAGSSPSPPTTHLRLPPSLLILSRAPTPTPTQVVCVRPVTASRYHSPSLGASRPPATPLRTSLRLCRCLPSKWSRTAAPRAQGTAPRAQGTGCRAAPR